MSFLHRQYGYLPGRALTGIALCGALFGAGAGVAVAQPAAPVAAAATSILQNTFTANWGPSTGATGYILMVATDAAFANRVFNFDTLNVGNVTTYGVTGLAANTQYYYMVRAYDGGGLLSPVSNAISLTTLPNAPAAPVVAAASFITPTSFSANWAASTGALGYRLDVASDQNFTTFVTGFNNQDMLNVLTAPVTGLSSNTQYWYRVRAYNTGGTSGNSTSSNPTTLPVAPVATSASSVTEASMSANWDAVTGAAGYRLDVATNLTFTTIVAGYSSRDVGNVMTFPVTGLSASTQYWYRVRAYNLAGGVSANSNNISQLTVSGVPTAGAASNIAQTTFSANWSSVPSAGGYRVDVATDSVFTSFVSPYNDFNAGSLTSLSVSGLTASTAYYYRVRSYNGVGSSSNSSVISVLTLPTAPGVPTATAATLNTLTSFSANWNAASGATSYRLDVATDVGFSSILGSYNNLNVLNVTTYSVTGLTAGTAYWYRVRAVNAGGTTGSSNVIATGALPAAPVVGAATAATQTSFSANWMASAGATGYRLDVSTDSFATYVTGDSSRDVGNVTTFSVTGLNPGTTYSYRVRAYNAGGTSANSGTTTTATLAGAPTATAATAVTASSFSANWNASGGATGYRLDVSTDIGFGSFVPGYNDLVVGNVLTQSVTTLAAGTTYYYRVRAVNAGGTTASSNTVTVPTLPASPLATAATAVLQTSFSANWGATTGATGYRLDVSTNGGFTSYLPGDSLRDVGTVTTFSVTGLAANTQYYYRIRAYNGSGAGAVSNLIMPTTLPNAPPAPVAGAATVIAQTSFTANWAASAGATGYYIDVATDGAFMAFVAGDSLHDVGNVTTISLSGFAANTQYYYRVRAYNTGGTGATSNVIALTTLPNIPAAPVAIAATGVLKGSFSAGWNGSIGATGYRLDVATDAGFTAILASYNNRDVLSVTTFSVTGLAANTPYYYRVRAYNTGGTSTSSSAISVTTLGPLVVTTNSLLPNGTAGTAYSTTIVATGAVQPYAWSLASGALPHGMTLNPISGVISGIPDTARTWNFSIRVIGAANSDTSTASFALTVVAGGAANIVLGNGDLQTVAVGTAFPVALAAVVTDVVGNPVPNATVTFTSPGTGANGTFVGSVRLATVLTNASGIATAPALTANTISGSYADTARISSGALVVYRLTNAPGAANKVRVETLANGAGTIFGQNVSSGSSVVVYAIVRDQYDNFIGNQTATWTLVPTAGVVRADLVPANGVASLSATFTGGIIGTAQMTAIITGLTSVPSGVFSVVVAGVPTKILVETAANGTGVVFPDSGFASGRSIAVYAIARDNANNFVRNLPALWSLVGTTGSIQRSDLSAPVGVGALSATFTGHATGTVRMQADSGAITGTPSGLITVHAGNPAAITATGGSGQSAVVNSPFATRLASTVVDSSGNPVPGRLVIFTGPPLTGPSGTFAGGVNTATTDANGVATALILSANSRAGVYSDTARVAGVAVPALFVLTNISGGAATLTPAPGTTPQHVQVGNSVAIPLAVVVRDTSGNPVSGVSVTFTAPNTPATGFPKSQTVSSDNSGIATLPQYQVNGVAGPDTVVATAPGIPLPAKFIISNDPGSGQSFFATAGSGQSALVRARFADSLQVRATDGPAGTGNGVSGILVTFSAPPAGASVIFRRSGSFTDTVRTDANGYATSSGITADSIAGAYIVGALAPTLTSVPFALTNNAGVASKFSVEAYPATGPIGKQIAMVPFDVLVTARDAYNNPSTIVANPDSIFVTSNGPLLTGGGASPFGGSVGVVTVAFQQAGSPDTIKVARIGGTERGASNGFAVENPMPVVTAISPPNARKGQIVDLVITGTGFLSGVSTPAFGIYFTLNSWTIIDQTHMQVNLLIKANAPDSAYDVTVFNPGPGGGSGILRGGFGVGKTPSPKITSLGSVTGTRLSTFGLVIRGTGFFGGVTSVSLGAGIRLNTMTVDSVNQITANVTIGGGAALGPRNVIVANTVPAGTGGGADTAKNGFAVLNPVPALVDVEQQVGTRLGTYALTFNGSNFIPGCTVSFADTGMIFNSVVVDTTAYQKIAVNVTITPSAFLGAHSASVTNPAPGGGIIALPSAFSVFNPSPTLDALLPNTGSRQQTLDVICKGTNFVTGVTQVFFRDSITVNSLRVDSTTQMTANITVRAGASLGMRYVRVYNPAPGGDSSGAVAFTITPPASPIPVLLSPLNANGYQSTVVRVTWSPSPGANSYLVQVSKAPNGTFQPVDSAFATSDTTTQLGPLTLGTKYYWRVASTNVQGGISAFSAPWSFTAAYPLQITVKDTVTFPRRASSADYLQADYRLFGLPGSSPVAVQKYFTGVSEQDWRVVWDNGGATNYWVPFASGPTFTFGSGRAFWVLNKGNLVVADSVLSSPLDNGGNSVIPLHAGWNIITSPYSKPVSWLAVTVANPPMLASHRLTGYRSGFRDTTLLLPYEGFYFENTANLPSLLIPFAAAVGKARESSTPGVWTMRINLATDTYVDRVAILGVSPDARRGKDSLDAHRPVVFDGIPVVIFNRPEWDATASVFGSDYRPLIRDVETWEFEVRSKLRAPIRLDFDGVASIPEEFASYIIDHDRARAVDLRAGSVYAFSPTTDVSRFSVVVGRPEKVQEQLVAMLPREFALDNNFPNPFNPTTTIPVSLPRAGEIRLIVYNMLGEEVRQLYAGSLEAGRYWFKWDGRNERGNSVASGVYFVRMTTGGLSFVRKMSLLK